MRPDIVLTFLDGQEKVVLDTKWKIPQSGQPTDDDLKQMYVYHRYWDAKKTYLLYPRAYKQQVKKKGCYHDNDMGFECYMYYLDVIDGERLNNNLGEFIKEFSGAEI
ncbi:hypothetical protein V6R21_25470 [Limibacter armeniacum]|uniref:5-methylcytosine restriction system specificity protein McrC n=1 Tax=Limibacter armeniacum TaxID=466084 RepID=UPI002FE56003